MYRYNFGVHFVVNENLITLIYPQKKILIKGGAWLWDFLKYALLNVYVQDVDLKKYKVTPEILQLLLSYKVLVEVCTYKSWSEAWLFHQLAENPNKVDTDLDQNAINTLYKNASVWVEELIDRDVFTTAFWQPSSGLHSQNMSNIQGSARKNTKSLIFDDDFLKTSFYTHLFKNSNWHHRYGSGWWFYSVFPLSITENDTVYVFDPKTWVTYTAKMPGIYQACSNILLFDHEYRLTWYWAIVILLSNTQYVFQKYWNRWYRFVLIESGAIWCLLRQLYSERGYLEMWWYYDTEVYNIIKKYNLLINLENILVTHLILLSH